MRSTLSSSCRLQMYAPPICWGKQHHKLRCVHAACAFLPNLLPWKQSTAGSCTHNVCLTSGMSQPRSGKTDALGLNQHLHEEAFHPWIMVWLDRQDLQGLPSMQARLIQMVQDGRSSIADESYRAGRNPGRTALRMCCSLPGAEGSHGGLVGPEYMNADDQQLCMQRRLSSSCQQSRPPSHAQLRGLPVT